MDEDVLRYLKDLSQQLKNAIPGMESAVETLKNNPTAIEIRELAKQARETVPDTIRYFVEEVEYYRQPFLENLKNALPALKQFADAVKAASPATRLGEMQFVWWKNLPKELFDEFSAYGYEDKACNAILDNWICKYEPTEAIDKLKTNNYLMDYPVFQQSISAYDAGNYDIAALGFTACFDRMLSICSGLPTHKIDKRVNELVERLRQMNEEDINFSDDDLSDYYLLVTYPMMAESFSETAPFEDLEPPTLNRHWLMHGRMEREITRLECNKLINLLYGTILIAEMIGEVS